MKQTIKTSSVILASAFLMFGFASPQAHATAISSDDTSACVKVVVKSSEMKIEKGTKNAKISEVKLTNNCKQEVQVTGAGFMGNFGSSTIAKTRLAVNGTDAGAPNQNKSYGINYTALNLKLKPGISVDLVLTGDIASSIKDKTLSIRFNSCPQVFLVKSVETGNKVKFTVEGKSYITITCPKVIVFTQLLKANVFTGNNRVKKGEHDAKLAEAKLTNTGTEDLIVSGIGFMGTFCKCTVTNPKIYVSDAAVGKTTMKSWGAVYNGMTLRINKGASVNVVLKGDVAKNVGNKAFSYRLDSCPNVFVVKGIETGKKAKVTIEGKSLITVVKK